jgi:hypothetical protein
VAAVIPIAFTAPCVASEPSAKAGSYGHSVPGGLKVNIDGDRIARRKRFFQRLVKQVILMRYRGSKRFLRIFRGEHDLGAFFTFVSLSISGVCTINQRGVYDCK